jgi:iron complex outermembrane receptor protein
MVLFLVFLITIVSFAQDTVKIYYLGEIEVTAYRAGGEVLNLPMAISSIDRGDLVLKRMVGLSDVLNSVPGVLAQSRAGASDVRLTIRGFGSRGFGDKSNAATIRGIKILVDGFPETEPDGRTSLDFVDLLITERIEVIRTNTSTLFGNASGGIINFETPRVAKSFFELNGVAGSFGLTHSNVKIGLRSNYYPID